MPELVERIDVDASPEQVWATITDWERQGEWMLLTDVRTVGGPAQRLHGRLAAHRAAPARRPPPRRARHHDHHEVGAAAAGGGAAHRPHRPRARCLRGRPSGEQATLVCSETWYLPYGLLGRVGWALSRPFVVWGLRRSLQRFAVVAEARPALTTGTALGEDVPVAIGSWAGERT